MKLIGFAQLRNELSKGNLENWFKCMSVCDFIYIYDQNSTDGSLDYYKQFINTVVIESPINDFSNEIVCKHKLLKLVLEDHPDCDYIFWMDGDTLLDNRAIENNGAALKQNILEYGLKEKVDCFCVNHYNLWRSDIFYRIDDHYHDLNGGVAAFWRNTGELEFPILGNKLHAEQNPAGMKTAARIDLALIHRGFATDYQIMLKYDIYKERGQSGWALERLLNEETLQVELLPKGILPSWFKLTDTEIPNKKKKIREIYNEQKH
jgi:hypothetical protein